MTVLSSPRDAAEQVAPDADPPLYHLIELLFFAYRDFVRDADELLATYRFGRAHHRVLHFVSRNPGLKVSDLLAILKVTKQSLGRVLRELVAEGFIDSREGRSDRRNRLLFATPRGERLARSLADLQTRRIRGALADLDPAARDAAARFLFAMIDPVEQPLAAALVGASLAG